MNGAFSPPYNCGGIIFLLPRGKIIECGNFILQSFNKNIEKNMIKMKKTRRVKIHIVSHEKFKNLFRE